jgi:hypothetical protein
MVASSIAIPLAATVAPSARRPGAEVSDSSLAAGGAVG